MSGFLEESDVKVEDTGVENPDRCKSCFAYTLESDALTLAVCNNCGALQTRHDVSLVSDPEASMSSKTYSEDSLQQSFKYRRFIARLVAVATIFKLPTDITEQITTIADRSFRDSNLKRLPLGPRIASCIYIVTKKYESMNISLLKLSKIVQSPVNHIYKCLKLFLKKLELDPLPQIGYVARLEIFCTYVPNVDQQELFECAIKIESVVRLHYNGVNAVRAAAALLKVAADAKGTPFKFKKLCDDFSVSYHHTMNLTRDIRKSLFEVSKNIPWRPRGINFKNVTKFLPEILRYHAQFGNDEEEKPDSENATDAFREKAKWVLKMREEGKMINKNYCKDPVILIIDKLLERGCSSDEVLNDSMVMLSRQYLDYMDEKDYDDEEIPDEDIDVLLRAEGEEYRTMLNY